MSSRKEVRELVYTPFYLHPTQQSSRRNYFSPTPHTNLTPLTLTSSIVPAAGFPQARHPHPPHQCTQPPPLPPSHPHPYPSPPVPAASSPPKKKLSHDGAANGSAFQRTSTVPASPLGALRASIPSALSLLIFCAVCAFEEPLSSFDPGCSAGRLYALSHCVSMGRLRVAAWEDAGVHALG